ncbi:MAG: hypothetical protein VYA34_05200 [Myxococcota bacterium]|nr:hypothetical protein [Myxococcota bacterium]
MDDGLLQILAFIGYLILANVFRTFRNRGTQGATSTNNRPTAETETTYRDFRDPESNCLDEHWVEDDDVDSEVFKPPIIDEDKVYVYRGAPKERSLRESVEVDARNSMAETGSVGDLAMAFLEHQAHGGAAGAGNATVIGREHKGFSCPREEIKDVIVTAELFKRLV